jgi:predicted nuclease with TOPRIM domain
LIKKAWVKFDGMTVKCICDDNNRKCAGDKSCKEYVIRFTEIERSEKVNDAIKHLEKEQQNLEKTIKKFESQVSKSIKKFKI